MLHQLANKDHLQFVGLGILLQVLEVLLLLQVVGL